MGDGSPLKSFIRINSSGWQLAFVPHSKTEAGAHTVKLIALASDGTKTTSFFKIEVEQSLVP